MDFLTKSHLPRLLLREIWNVVDPHQVGRLVQPEQWWTLLKLVALAQQQQQQQETNVQDLITQLQSTVTPLPVFDNVIIPTMNVLLQEYSVEDGVDEVSLNVSSGGGAAPFPNVSEWNHGETVIQPQQQHDNAWSNAPLNFNAPKQTKSLAAALDELSAGICKTCHCQHLVRPGWMDT